MGNNKDIKEYISVDFSMFNSRTGFHLIMKMLIGGEAYSGNNLDALHDALTSIGKRTVFIFSNEEAGRENLGGYFDKIRKVFEDSERENDNISVSRGNEFTSGNL